mgnify:FL=1
MKNTVTKKILAGAMLFTFAFSNTLTAVFAASIGDYLGADVSGTLLAQELQGIRGLSNPTPVTPDVFTGVSSQTQAADDKFYSPTVTIPLKGESSLTTKTMPITLSLRDSDVKQVLRMFADKAGLNIIFENGVAGTVTMDLVDVPLNSAFEMIMEMNELYYLIDNNTLIVYSDPGKTTINMKKMIAIPVKYIDAMPMASFLNKNIFGLKKPGLSNTLVATTNPRKNEVLIFGTENDAAIARKIIEQFDTKPEFKTYKVNHVTPDVMADMLCTQLLPTIIDVDSSKKSDIGQITGAAADSSGSSLSIGGGTIACGYTSSMNATNSSSSGSVEFSSLPLLALEISYSPGLGTVNVMGATPHQISLIEDFIKQNDKKEPQAYLEVSIIEVSESGSKTMENSWQVWSKYFSATFANGTTATNPLYPIFFKGDRYSVVDMTGDEPEVKYTIQKFSGTPTITYAINYLLENGKARVVANPRILVTNGQESTIDLTSDYVKSVTSQVISGVTSGAAQRDYDIADDNGIKVALTAFISPDGYVTLNIKPEYATIKEQIYSPTEDSQTPDLAATLLQRRNLDLKNVRIKDGETLVIGGMLRDDETKSVKKIPFLGDIPYIGAMFRSTSTKKSKEEMVIMITPKIITDNEDAISGQETL